VTAVTLTAAGADGSPSVRAGPYWTATLRRLGRARRWTPTHTELVREKIHCDQACGVSDPLSASPRRVRHPLAVADL